MNVTDLLCPVCGGTGLICEPGPDHDDYSHDDGCRCPNNCVGVVTEYDVGPLDKDVPPTPIVRYLIDVVLLCETHVSSAANDPCRPVEHCDMALAIDALHVADTNEPKLAGICHLVPARVEKVGELA